MQYSVLTGSAMTYALKFHAVVSGKTLVLPDLSAFEGKRVEVIVVEDDAGPPDAPAVGGRRLLPQTKRSDRTVAR